VIAAILLAAAAHGAKSKAAAPPAVPKPITASAKVVQGADGWRADLELDGWLYGWTVVRSHDGGRDLYMLVGPRIEAAAEPAAKTCDVRPAEKPEKRTGRLFRWRPSAPDRLDEAASGLPIGTLASGDLDDDGNDELYLTRRGGIDRVIPGAEAHAEVHQVVGDLPASAIVGGPSPELRVNLLGAFRTYRRSHDGGVALVSELPITQKLVPARERIRVESSAVNAIGRLPSGRPGFATDAEPLGTRRLRTQFLDPDGPADARAIESWALLPTSERVVDRGLALLDGAPVLIVTTTGAEKLSLLKEKMLRIYPLGGDRTRAGDNPLFATSTGINLWQEAYPTVVDLDHDGRQDLVFAYWKGLKNAIAALEVYRGGESPRFAKPKTTSFDVTNGEKSYLAFGVDMDGDGRPDLMLLANHELLVYPGTAPDRAIDRPVESKPSRRLPLPADLPEPSGRSVSVSLEGGFQIGRAEPGLGTPQHEDLGGPNPHAIVFAGNLAASHGRVVVAFFRGAGR